MTKLTVVPSSVPVAVVANNDPVMIVVCERVSRCVQPLGVVTVTPPSIAKKVINKSPASTVAGMRTL